MLGEFELIARIRELVGGHDGREPGAAAARVVVASGDDAAVTVPTGATVTSVDALVEDVHFRRGLAPLRSIGAKALATSLSDLAAMGARPGEAYVQLGVPPDLDDAGCLELAEGLAAVAGEHGVAVLGGDLTRSAVLFVAVTVVGHAPSAEAVVTRAGARPGDAVAVTGELGGAAAGLELLEAPALSDGLPAELADRLRRRQLEPAPRLAAGLALADAGATAMIDVSDGLGADAAHVAEASAVALAIELERLPLEAGLGEVAAAAGAETLGLAITGGEDYELLATIPPERVASAREAVAASGSTLSVIGAVAEGRGVSLRDGAGRAWPAGGFDQRRGRRAAGPGG